VRKRKSAAAAARAFFSAAALLSGFLSCGAARREARQRLRGNEAQSIAGRALALALLRCAYRAAQRARRARRRATPLTSRALAAERQIPIAAQQRRSDAQNRGNAAASLGAPHAAAAAAAPQSARTGCHFMASLRYAFLRSSSVALLGTLQQRSARQNTGCAK
jgi:hypothetical protein